jgi:ATP-binding cassette subfamily C protein CydD
MPAQRAPAGRPGRRLARWAPAARAGVAAAVAAGLLTAALAVVQAVLLARVIARSFDGAGLGSLAGTLVALAAVLAARAAVGYAGEVAAARAAIEVKRQLRGRLLRRALALGPGWLARRGTGELTTLATRGLDGLDGYLGRYLPQLVLATVLPAAVLVVLAAADWRSAVVVLLTVPLIPAFLALIGLRTQAATERQWSLLQRLGGHFLDVVEGLPTLTVFRRAQAQVATIREITGAHRRATMRTLRIAFLSALVLELLATLAVAVVAVEVGLRLLAGQVPYQTALLVLLLAPEAYLPLRRLGAEYHAGREGSVAAAAALAVLAEAEPRAGRPAAAAGAEPIQAPAGGVAAATGELRLAGVVVRYPDRERPALADVSLVVPAGQRVALLGASGTGKSSLFAVLLRFVAPAAGEVTFGGLDLLAGPPAQWRRQIAWVPQQPHLLAGTVAENVQLGRPDATDAELAEVARLVGLDAVLAGLPDGWATRLGERGLRLSAGQRQRVALARALLRDAPLLLLDEPTAHLDADSAASVRHAVLDRAAGRTVLVISHDAGWPAAVDRVLWLEAGRLVEAEPGGPPGQPRLPMRPEPARRDAAPGERTARPVPAVPGMSAVPAVPGTTAVPAVPGATAVPAVPVVPGTTAVPAVPGLTAVRAVPG